MSDTEKKSGFSFFGRRKKSEEIEPTPIVEETSTSETVESSPLAIEPEQEAPQPSVEVVDPPAIETEVKIEADPETAPKKVSFFRRMRTGLSRSSSSISDGVTGIFTKAKLDDEALENLEDLLITADLGLETVTDITTKLAKERFDKNIEADEVKRFVAEEIATILDPLTEPIEFENANKPHVILVVGVNGSGKTTTIGKMANQAKLSGKSVMLAAGDTFRAAAIEQLKIWGDRIGAPVVAREVGSDAAGLAFDALTQAKEEGTDVLFIDTAGRLQNKANLMAELEKVERVIKKVEPSAPHAVLLVLDATTGQNALTQVAAFKDTSNVSGLVMTKLDGTARGGILVAVGAKFGLPIHAIGVGESIDDFQPFQAQEFANALVGLDD